MFNFPKCRDCNATLPIATGICPHCTQLSPAPAQQSQSDSVAAPAEVGQGLGTTDIYQDFFSSISALFSLSASHRYGSLEHRALMDGIAALRIVLSERGFPDELVFAQPERCA
jgi:hypothetical protein